MKATLTPTGEATARGQLNVFVSRGPDPFEPPDDWEEGDDWQPKPPAVSLAAAVVDTEPREQHPVAGRTYPVERAPLGWRVRNWFRMLRTGEHFAPLVLWAVRQARKPWVKRVPLVGKTIGGLADALTIGIGSVYLTKFDGERQCYVSYGLVGQHTVCTAGKQAIASTFDNTTEPEVFKYHGFGSGTTAASAADTALQTEYTTQYATDNVRPTGSQAHSGATYTSVGTFAPDSGGTLAVTEWGLLNQASNAGGTILDHQVFSAVNLVAANGDTLATTYVLTIG